MSSRAIYLTALVEGTCVLIVEIAGARALAPFLGTSLQVWASQITHPKSSDSRSGMWQPLQFFWAFSG